MMTSKKITQTLFGRTFKWNSLKNHRSCTLVFPAAEDGGLKREITYRTDDGLILAILKKIEKLEKQIVLQNRPLNIEISGKEMWDQMIKNLYPSKTKN